MQHSGIISVHKLSKRKEPNAQKLKLFWNCIIKNELLIPSRMSIIIESEDSP